MKDFYHTFVTAHEAYMRGNLSDQLEKLTNTAKRLIVESSTTEVSEYPIGCYNITPSEELIDVLDEIGQLLLRMDKDTPDDKHISVTYIKGIEYVFKGLSRNVGNVCFRYKATVTNSSTFYTSMRVEKSVITDVDE